MASVSFTCQGWTLSSQMVICFSLETVSPFSVVAFHCHQISVPGGSAPLSRMSHSHLTLTCLPGVKSGKARAWTSLQVRSSVPYNNSISVIFSLLLMEVENAAEFG